MKSYNYSAFLEEDGKEKNGIVLDTCSVDKIINNANLLETFFKKLSKLNSRAIIPFAAFSEISDNQEVFQRFNNLYKKKNDLKIIWEPLDYRIRREIESPIESNLYLKKEIDLYKTVDEDCYKKNVQYNKNLKKVWQENCKNKRIQFQTDHPNLTPEERNKKINEKLEKSDFLINYMNQKTQEPPFWVLSWFEQEYGDVIFPKKQIYSNKNRYKHINLLQYLMLINMYRSILTGKSILSANKGDLFDMDIASFSAYSSSFISDDEGLVFCLKKIKDNSESLGFENKYKIYHKVESFITQ